MREVPLTDEIIYRSDVPPTTKSQDLLVFFITGNPGLIEYYRYFLSLLYSLLQDLSFSPLNSKENVRLNVCVRGTSLANFNVTGQQSKHGLRNLEQQISHIEGALDAAVQEQKGSQRAGSPLRIVMIGHSVGAYILLEVLRRRKERQRSSAGGKIEGKVIGGICLFPTVTHIAESPSGKKFSLFFAIPHFALVASTIARLLTFWVPSSILQRVVSLVTGMSAAPARTTAAFIKSQLGIRQALYLANDEMRTITSDNWDDELWGIASERQQGAEATKLFFYFGQNDHWVADNTRDELVAARAFAGKDGDERKPVMEIDQSGIPHGFCISHNDPVARKVAEYIRTTVETNW